jgi:hypothetical protein
MAVTWTGADADPARGQKIGGVYRPSTEVTDHSNANVPWSISWCLAQGGAGVVIELPPDDYDMGTGALTLPDWATIRGAKHQLGIGASGHVARLKFTLASGTAITTGEYATIEDLQVVNDSGAYDDNTYVYSGSTAVGVLTGGTGGILRNVTFQKWDKAVKFSGSPYYFRSENVEFNRCDEGYHAETETPFNLQISNPTSQMTNVFFGGTGVYARNIKVFGGSIEHYEAVARNFNEIAFFGTYFETQAGRAGTDVYAIDPGANNATVALYGCLAYLDGTARFVNLSGYEDASLVSSGNTFEGYDASAANAIVFYLPATGSVSTSGDRVSSAFQDTAQYTNTAAAFLLYDMQMPLLPAGNALVALSGRRSVGGQGFTMTARATAPTSPTLGQTVLADGSGWNPLSWADGRPYWVMWQGDRWYPLSGEVPTIAAANADTSGATLPQLEAEVNEIKAILRTRQILAP